LLGRLWRLGVAGFPSSAGSSDNEAADPEECRPFPQCQRQGRNGRL